MRFVVSFLIIFLCSQIAFASYPKPYRLPQSVRIEADGQKYEAFDLPNYKILLKMDYDLWHLNTLHDKFIFLQEKDAFIIENLQRQNFSQAHQIHILKKERDRLIAKWEHENKQRHICENKPKTGSWLAWGTAGVASVVAAVLGVILLAK